MNKNDFTRLEKRGINWGKVFAFILTVLMALSDYYTLQNLYTELDLDLWSKFFAVLSMVLSLEGIPYFLGGSLGKLMDKARDEDNVKANSLLVVILGLVGLIGVWYLSVKLRLYWIEHNGGEAAFDAGVYGGRKHTNEEYIIQFQLTVMPILTSVLAFVASAAATGNPALEKAEKICLEKRKNYLVRQEKFQIAYQKCREARTSLWTSLADPAVTQMPDTMEDFRNACFSRIRAKLVDNCITAYPSQLERYTSEVESALTGYLLEMSRHTTLPQSITKLTLKEIVDEYEASCADYADYWNPNVAGPDLEDDLRRTLDNAVVVAQFKTAIAPYYLEKER